MPKALCMLLSTLVLSDPVGISVIVPKPGYASFGNT